MAEGEAAEAAPAATEKKSKKKLIIMVVVFGLIGYVVATKTVLKPPPPTPVELAAKTAVKERELEITCAKANGKVPPPPLDEKLLIAAGGHEPAEGTMPTPTTVTTLPGTEKEKPAGPMLVLDPVTVNLADNSYLKFSLGLQLPPKTAMEEIEVENPGTAAQSFVVEEMRKKKSKDFDKLSEIRKELGYKICTDPKKNAEGKITTIYFPEFVTQ